MKKTNAIQFVIASLFVLVFSMSAISAITFQDTVNTITLNQNQDSTSFTLKSDMAANFSANANSVVLADSNGNSITLTLTALNSLNETTEVIYNVNASGDLSAFNFPEFDSENIQFTIVNSTNALESTSKNVTFKFENADFCEDCESIGKLKVTIDEINTLSGFGDDDSFWYPYDVIEVSVLIENDGCWDMRDLELSWALYTEDGKKILSDKEKSIDLDYNEDDTLSFTFTLDKSINEFDNSKAVLYVKAKGQINDNDSPYDDNETCDSDVKTVEVKSGDDFLVLGNPMINSVDLTRDGNAYVLNGSVNCGTELTLDSDIVNIGDADQEDLYVRIYNSELKIDKKISFDKIKAFKDENLIFTFTLPKEIEEKWYSLEISVYDDGNDLYQTSEDDNAKYSVMFEVKDGCSLSLPLISARLDSEAKAGRELVIKTMITNTEDEQITFRLNPAAYTEWASLVEISDSTMVLNAGESKEITLTFKIEKGITGTQTFDLEVVANNEFLMKQPISIDVEESKFNLFDFIKNNWLVSGLAVLILLLIIAIIIVAVRVSRR